MQYFRPTELTQALNLLARHEARIAAGCTDLFPATAAPALRGRFMDITAIDCLRGISHDTQGWRIGATTRWSDITKADLPRGFDALKLAAAEIGSVQIQNMGTVAGNLCNASPAADGVPALLILDACVEIANLSSRRIVPLRDFIAGARQIALAKEEMVTAILVTERAAHDRTVFLKLGARRHLIISIVMIAAKLDIRQAVISNAAVAVGACSPVALRLEALERWLNGRATAQVADFPDALVMDALSPLDDVRADSAYRRSAATVLVRRALSDLARRHRSEAA